MTTLRPLRNVIMFQFLEETFGKKGAFIEPPRESGLIILTSNDNQKISRWGQVVAAGPDADVATGDYVLIEAMMWMEGVTIDDMKVWKTDSSKVLCVTNDRASAQPQAYK